MHRTVSASSMHLNTYIITFCVMARCCIAQTRRALGSVIAPLTTARETCLYDLLWQLG